MIRPSSKVTNRDAPLLRSTSSGNDVAKKEPTAFLDFARGFGPYFLGEKNASAMGIYRRDVDLAT